MLNPFIFHYISFSLLKSRICSTHSNKTHFFSIIKLLINTSLVFLLLSPISSAQTEVEGEVSGVWDVEGSPYILIENVTVPEDEELEIEPGVEVIFNEDKILLIEGDLITEGTEDDSIYFHGEEGLVTGFLRFFPGSDLQFTFCRFDSLNIALWGWGRDVSMESCRITNNHRIDISGGDVIFKNNHMYSDSSRQRLTIGNERLELAGDVSIEYNQCYNSVFFIRGAINIDISNNNAVLDSSNGHHDASSIRVTDSRYIEIYENQIFNISISESGIGYSIREVEVHDNTILDMTSSFVASSTIKLFDNIVMDELEIESSIAEVYNNTIDQVEVIGEWTAARIVTNVLLRNNLISYPVVVGDTCEVELINNTIVVPHFSPGRVGNIIKKSEAWHEYESTVFLLNNILVSYNEDVVAVEEEIEHVDGGYNCIWGPQTAYEGSDDLFEGDTIANPLFVGGHPFEYQLQANSPCIDAGDPDSDEDPDSTRADIGNYYYDQTNGMPPAIISDHYTYATTGSEFSYTAQVTDNGGEITFEFDGLPDWLGVEEQLRRDFIDESVTLTGDVPEDQEDFIFVVNAYDDDDNEDTLSVQVFILPYTVLKGNLSGVLTIDDSPYVITDTAWVVSEDSLIIEAGCEGYFDNSYYEGRPGSLMIVDGIIRALGTEEDSIYVKRLYEDGSKDFFLVRETESSIGEFNYCRFGVQTSVISYANVFKITHCYHDSGSSSKNRNVNSSIEFSNNTMFGSIIGLKGSGKISDNQFISLSAEPSIGISIAGDSIVVENNLFKYHKYPIYFQGRKGIIRNNLIKDGGGTHPYGIQVLHIGEWDEVSELIVESNVFEKISGIGMVPSRLVANIHNNLFFDSNYVGVVSHLDTITVSNNVFYRTGVAYEQYTDSEFANIVSNLFIENDVGFASYPEIGVNQPLRYNAIYSCDTLSIDSSYIGFVDRVNTNGDSCDAGYNIFREPHIVSLDSLDFHLYEWSPLINAGNPDSSFNDQDGTINDIGLYGGPFGEEYEYPNSVGKSDVPVPAGFEMSPLYPNPFNTTTSFEFSLPAVGDVMVNVYDVTGRLVYKNRIQNIQAGRHRSFWHGTDSNGLQLSTGIYFIELTYQGAKLVRRGIMLK